MSGGKLGRGTPVGTDANCETGLTSKFGCAASSSPLSRDILPVAGGLLIVYANIIKGNGNYQAISGGSYYTGNGYVTNCNADGGGSINIFGLDVSQVNLNNISANIPNYPGFSSGNGTYNVGSISTGIYIPRN